MNKNNDIEGILKWQNKMLEKCGYYVHLVDDYYEDGLVSFHTHGFNQKYNKPEIEIVLNISQQTVKNIFDYIQDCYEEGEEFTPGIEYDNIIINYTVKFIKVIDEDGQEFLRLLLPDENNKFPDDEECQGIFAKQINTKFRNED